MGPPCGQSTEARLTWPRRATDIRRQRETPVTTHARTALARRRPLPACGRIPGQRRCRGFRWSRIEAARTTEPRRPAWGDGPATPPQPSRPRAESRRSTPALRGSYTSAGLCHSRGGSSGRAHLCRTCAGTGDNCGLQETTEPRRKSNNHTARVVCSCTLSPPSFELRILSRKGCGFDSRRSHSPLRQLLRRLHPAAVFPPSAPNCTSECASPSGQIGEGLPAMTIDSQHPASRTRWNRPNSPALSDLQWR
jgi:hypothetical protein